MNFIKKHAFNLGLIALFLTGSGLIAYPSFSDWWNSFHQSRAVAAYANTVADLSTEQYEKLLRDADRYNRFLAGVGNIWRPKQRDLEIYESLLNINDSGIMGYIDIPKINVTLPIYHGIDEATLQIAVGHIPGTSLPVGGRGSHCVVSGHRGLPSARLFTDIDRISEGDTWTITVLNRTVTYLADQIRVVEPTDLSELPIEQGKDYCTLVTCTPYGINTHRLLVRGHRISNLDGEAMVVADAIQIDTIYIAPFIAAPILFLLVVGVFLTTSGRGKGKKVAAGGERGRGGTGGSSVGGHQ